MDGWGPLTGKDHNAQIGEVIRQIFGYLIRSVKIATTRGVGGDRERHVGRALDKGTGAVQSAETDQFRVGVFLHQCSNASGLPGNRRCIAPAGLRMCLAWWGKRVSACAWARPDGALFGHVVAIGEMGSLRVLARKPLGVFNRVPWAGQPSAAGILLARAALERRPGGREQVVAGASVAALHCGLPTSAKRAES